MLSRSFIKSNQILFFMINIIIPEVDVTLTLILLKMNVHYLSIDVYFFIKVVKIIFIAISVFTNFGHKTKL